MKITVEELERYALIMVEGSLSNEHQKDLNETITRVMEDHRFILVDFSKLIFITSSGLGLLLKKNVIAKEKGRKLLLFGLSEDMAQLFKLTELYYHLNVRDTFEDCLDDMKKSEN